ncbi:unnamed protein product [Amoebophrya sp. A120]|nr:unnamed protein product [Amoebophrya sp. A120]|eukprot:GSA120T00005135001.1
MPGMAATESMQRVTDCPRRLVYLLDQLSKTAAKTGCLPQPPRRTHTFDQSIDPGVQGVDHAGASVFGNGVPDGMRAEVWHHDSSDAASGSTSWAMAATTSDRHSKKDARQEFLGVWNVYATTARDLVPSMTISELATVVRCCCRVRFTKHSLLKRISDRLYVLLEKAFLQQTLAETTTRTARTTRSTGSLTTTSPSSGPSNDGAYHDSKKILDARELCQFLHDLAKLEYLKPDLFLRWRNLVTAHARGLGAWRSFDLPLLVTTLARIGLRDTYLLAAVSRELASRLQNDLQDEPSQKLSARRADASAGVAAFLYGTAVLNYVDPHVLDVLDYSRSLLYEFSVRERTNVAFALLLYRVVAMDPVRGAVNSGSLIAVDDSPRPRTAHSYPDHDHPTATERPGAAARQIDKFFSALILDNRVLAETDTRARHQLRILAASVECGLISTATQDDTTSVRSGEGRPTGFDELLDAHGLRGKGRHGSCVELTTNTHTSVFQKSARRVFEELGVVYKEEVRVGPYQVDYLLKHRVAVEFDGYSHFYLNLHSAEEQREVLHRQDDDRVATATPEQAPRSADNIPRGMEKAVADKSCMQHLRKAKTLLKHALLEAMGIRVVSVPYADWLSGRQFEKRKEFFVNSLFQQTGSTQLSEFQQQFGIRRNQSGQHENPRDQNTRTCGVVC